MQHTTHARVTPAKVEHRRVVCVITPTSIYNVGLFSFPDVANLDYNLNCVAQLCHTMTNKNLVATNTRVWLPQQDLDLVLS